MIPLVNIKRDHEPIKEKLNAAIQDVLESTVFIQAVQVAALEKEFASYCGTTQAIAMNSGTAALQLALQGLGIKEGDEVITVPFSFFATAEAIVTAGAKPVFVDVHPKTYTLDPEKLEKAITAHTKAIIPVHLYGYPADMEQINEIAKRHHLAVLEDSCQAHGASYLGEKVGGLSDAAAFSFYPTKNLGGCGEGGIITTNNDEVARKARLLRAHGEHPKNTHHCVGYNFRMEELQAAILRVKLRSLDRWNDERRKNALLYRALLKDVKEIQLPPDDDPLTGTKQVYHLFVIRTKERDRLQQYLTEHGIGNAVHYPTPIHLQPAFSHLGYGRGSFPVAEELMQQLLSIPMFPSMTAEEIKEVGRKVKGFFGG